MAGWEVALGAIVMLWEAVTPTRTTRSGATRAVSRRRRGRGCSPCVLLHGPQQLILPRHKDGLSHFPKVSWPIIGARVGTQALVTCISPP